MKAARYVAPGQVELLDIPMPAPLPRQVLVRLDTVGICGSDLHVLYDSPASDFPFAPGLTVHECTGAIADACGMPYAVGERMLVIPPKADALVEYLAVEPRWLIPLPEHLEPVPGILGQQLGTVIFCCRKLSNVLDKTVIVVGQGPAGVMFSGLLNHMGARQVIGLDVVGHRLVLARRLGATHTVDVSCDDPITAVRDLTAGHMADVVIEAVGKTETINLCPELVRSGGELVLFGIPKLEVFPFAYGNFFRKYLRTITSADAQGEPGLRSFRLALDLLALGRLDLTPLITHRLPLSRLAVAFHLAQTKQDGAAKVTVDVGSDTPSRAAEAELTRGLHAAAG